MSVCDCSATWADHCAPTASPSGILNKARSPPPWLRNKHASAHADPIPNNGEAKRVLRFWTKNGMFQPARARMGAARNCAWLPSGIARGGESLKLKV